MGPNNGPINVWQRLPAPLSIYGCKNLLPCCSHTGPALASAPGDAELLKFLQPRSAAKGTHLAVPQDGVLGDAHAVAEYGRLHVRPIRDPHIRHQHAVYHLRQVDPSCEQTPRLQEGRGVAPFRFCGCVELAVSAQPMAPYAAQWQALEPASLTAEAEWMLILHEF
jgi:hypothetical protein